MHQTGTTHGTYRICTANKKHSIGKLNRTGRTNRRHKVAKMNKTFGRGETIGMYGTCRTNWRYRSYRTERPNKTPLTNRQNATHKINRANRRCKHRCTRKHRTVRIDEVEHIHRVKQME